MGGSDVGRWGILASLVGVQAVEEDEQKDRDAEKDEELPPFPFGLALH